MKKLFLGFLTFVVTSIPTFAVAECYLSSEPYPFKLSKSDPLYEAARGEHQRYLEELEDYINCLARERSIALHNLISSYELYVENFGDDAVMKYESDN